MLNLKTSSHKLNKIFQKYNFKGYAKESNLETSSLKNVIEINVNFIETKLYEMRLGLVLCLWPDCYSFLILSGVPLELFFEVTNVGYHIFTIPSSQTPISSFNIYIPI